MSEIQGKKDLNDGKKTDTAVVNGTKERKDQKEVNSQIEYEFTNLPINRVIQNFFIDDKNEDNICIYGTMIRPNKQGKEDMLLIRFEVEKGSQKAMAKSFLVIGDGGHGTSLGGYYEGEELKLYVGCNQGNGVTLVDASVLKQKEKNKKNINYYCVNKSDKGWKNALGESIDTKYVEKVKVGSQIISFQLKEASIFDLTEEKRQVTNFSELCEKGEKFERADFVRASDGIPYVFIRYSKNNIKYLKIVRLSQEFDVNVAMQKKATSVVLYKKATSYRATMSDTIHTEGINGSWQSEDVYKYAKIRYFYLSTNSGDGKKLVIREWKKSEEKIIYYTYLIKSREAHNEYGEVKAEEIEGIVRRDNKIFFNRKTEYKRIEEINGEKKEKIKKIQTIESICLA